MNYGCDVSNRYTGYLDSSDHGNSMSTSIRKKKVKAKKKRRRTKSKNQKENSVEIIEPAKSNPPTEIYENHQTIVNDEKCDTTDKIENVQHDNDSTCPKCSTSSASCSPIQTDTSQDEVRMKKNEILIQKTMISSDGLNVNETKWSDICFEEEKNLIALESQSNTDAGTQRTLDVSESIQDAFTEHRIYPTIFIYNSKFGYRNRRFINWNNSGQHSNNETQFKHRDKNYNNDNYGNDGNNINNNNIRNEKLVKKRKDRNERRRKKNKSTKVKCHDHSDEKQSNDEQPANDTQYESNDLASIGQDEKNIEQTNQRQLNNTKNRYNRWTNGLPPQTFNRRRSDFVRNV